MLLETNRHPKKTAKNTGKIAESPSDFDLYFIEMVIIIPGAIP
jgi:hypothetical protein